ncbi:MAG TPA: sulfurtransferase [Propionibacteriaceae bacterium]|nr:sulfurtransferase [Propionibacteriaceae bacterium]
MRPLISASELQRLLIHDHVILLDVRWSLGESGGHDEYLAGHIPGAAYVDLEKELTGPPGTGGRHPLPPVDVFAEAMRRAGVTEDHQIVVYDGGSGLSAARLWWMLTDSGLRLVRVLNGGYSRWVARGLPVQTGEVTPVRSAFVPEPGHRPVVDPDGVMRHLAAGGAVYDVRAADRYRGDNETIDPVAGHIPGALSLPLGTLVRGGTYVPRGELAASTSHLRAGDVLSCGSGITAAAVMLAAEQAGVTGLVLFPGSWSQWISDPARPVATGPEPGALPTP